MENQKHLFSLDEGVHYLNNAYKAPLLKSCEEAALKAIAGDRTPIHLTPDSYFDTSERIRNEFSELVNCTPSQVALIPSSSYGLSSAMNNVPCGEGQHALTIENEFPSDYFALSRWAKKHDSTIKTIRPDATSAHQAKDWNERIMAAITSETAVLLMSSVHWMNGTVFDLEKIGAKCAETGTYFIVDGTQSVGARFMDVQQYQIDALICAAYKWLLGPYSTGLAYFSSKFNDGIPIEESWMNRTNAKEFSNLTTYEEQYTADAGRYNVGQTSNFILAPMLLKALEQLNTWGIHAIEAYAKELVEPLRNFLLSKGIVLEEEDFFSAHLFGIKLPETVSVETIKTKLAEERIFVSVRGNFIRVSVNMFNTSEDISKLIQALDKAL